MLKFHFKAPLSQRAELPDCTKLHSLALKENYDQCCDSRDYHFEEEVLAFLNSFIRDNERKIEVAKSRLHHTQDAPDNEERVRENLVPAHTDVHRLHHYGVMFTLFFSLSLA